MGNSQFCRAFDTKRYFRDRAWKWHWHFAQEHVGTPPQFPPVQDWRTGSIAVIRCLKFSPLMVHGPKHRVRLQAGFRRRSLQRLLFRCRGSQAQSDRIPLFRVTSLSKGKIADTSCCLNSSNTAALAHSSAAARYSASSASAWHCRK